MVSAHWEAAPITLGASDDGVPLVYDFYGFPNRDLISALPGAGGAGPGRAGAHRLGDEPVAQHLRFAASTHGAYVPLLVMYPQADVPVLLCRPTSLGEGRRGLSSKYLFW